VSVQPTRNYTYQSILINHHIVHVPVKTI